VNTRPFVVEFTGTPEAGKTTTIKQVIPIIKENLNCNVSFVQESAEIVPSILKKGSFEANCWMSEKAISSVLCQINNSSNDIIIADRGYIDRIFFGYKYFVEGTCSKDQYSEYMKTFSKPETLSNLCIVLKTTPEEAIRRRGGEGRLVTLEWVKSYNFILDDFLAQFQSSFATTCWFTLDTTNMSKSNVIEVISDTIITSYKNYKGIT